MKFRKIPVEIEAMQFVTDNDNSLMNEIVMWVNQGVQEGGRHAWHNGTNIFIQTLEGVMRANVRDWIIKGVAGEFYPCKPDIFEKTYEQVV